ncbi:hypothetical protein PIB30_106610 [Stylosanthes scabra]|uniref:Uncharacterized protein n=1 Tax=Stylosanthes scabra TaxID=79078 RepID=A0ABU6QZN3_9FABA|nr:hypothetical protein [Stylosanthes scabra]
MAPTLPGDFFHRKKGKRKLIKQEKRKTELQGKIRATVSSSESSRLGATTHA